MSRYIRQSQFPPIGQQGQRKIEASSVVVLGCGALGSVAAELLARAGVGKIRLIDRDIVEWSNLQRQSLYVEADAELGRTKAESAADALRRINSTIEIEEVVADVTPENIPNCIGTPDLIVDATDNFFVRLLLNDYALSCDLPWVHGGCVGATGQMRLFHGTPCFRCLVPTLPNPADIATCETAGVIGPATHLIASLQVTEAIKWLSGNRDSVRREVLSIDLWKNQVRAIVLPPGLSKDCPACGLRDFEFLRSHAASAQVLCGRNAVQIAGSSRELDLGRIANRWQSIGSTERSRFFVRLLLSEDRNLTLFRDGRAVVTGTSDPVEARVLYDRYLG